jgi:hypothetical protein
MWGRGPAQRKQIKKKQLMLHSFENCAGVRMFLSAIGNCSHTVIANSVQGGAGLSQDGGRADFAKKIPRLSLYLINRPTPLSVRSTIYLD